MINIAKISLLYLEVSHNEHLEIPVYHIKHMFFSNNNSSIIDCRGKKITCPGARDK